MFFTKKERLGFQVISGSLIIGLVLGSFLFFYLNRLEGLVTIIIAWLCINTIMAIPFTNKAIGKYIFTLAVSLTLLLFIMLSTKEYITPNAPKFMESIIDFYELLGTNTMAAKFIGLILGMGFINILFSHDTLQTIAMIHERTINLYGEKINECYFDKKIQELRNQKKREENNYNLIFLNIDEEIARYEGAKKILQEENKKKNS